MAGYSLFSPDEAQASFQAPTPVSPFPEGPETDALKLRYAETLARNPANTYVAARMLVADPQRANFMAVNWPYDEAVVRRMDELAAQGLENCLPTKAELVHSVLQAAEAVVSKDTKLDYLKLAANMLGYTQERGATNVNVNQQNNTALIVHKVMRVPVFGNREETREAIAAQQARLVNASP